ncbi:MAG TPA: PAS domain-containing protein [Solirubrobacterales bacterium]|nr:PAS domain-containing protein [Solirubrobacterales bacterium]
MSAGWERALGWTREELMSRPFGDFVHPNEREQVMALALEARPADSDLLTLENRFRARGGRWERVRWHPVLDEPGVAPLSISPAEQPMVQPVPGFTGGLRAGRAMVACLAVASLLVVAGLVFGLPAGMDTGQTTRVGLAGQLPASLHGPVDRYGPLVPSSRDWQAPPGSVGRPLTSRG